MLGLGLCMSTSCNKQDKRPFTAPPGLQPSYVDAGAVLHWVASGQPFEVSFYPVNPCIESQLVNSDGKTDIVCHVRTDATGNYSYSYSDPRAKQGPKLSQPGVFSMHVGPCTSCYATYLGTKVTVGQTTQEVAISCTGTN